MTVHEEPLVSVLTPVYNGEPHLAECIESVLSQTYSNWEYTIVNNCSTDRTLQIAEEYAKKDKRIHVHDNTAFLDIIGNHNASFRLISPESKYCKVVSGDDLIFPDCIAQMVALAEANPSVGIIGSYQLSGGNDRWYVRFTGLPYYTSVVSGREICRSHLLTPLSVFGAPTSILYRSDLIRVTDDFFPNPTAEADVSACFKHLRYADFGFVHQILSHERLHQATVTTISKEVNAYLPSKIGDLLTYGPFYLTSEEQDNRLKELMEEYYGFLAIGAANFRDNKFWSYHKRRLKELGHPLDSVRFAKAATFKFLDLLLNPKLTVERALKRL
jgi:glycosyltransferase involved in cell wall biosynthesis